MNSLPLDLRQTLAVARRLLAATPAQIQSRLSRAVRDAPDERLERLMQTPVRHVVLEALFWRLSQRLDPWRTVAIDASIRLRITGRSDRIVDVYDLELVVNRGSRSQSTRCNC